MRTIPSILLVGVLAAAAAPARANGNVAGTYDVKFEEAGSTCNPPPVTLGRGKLTIEIRRRVLTVNTDLIPIMTGAPQKNGKIKAATPKVVGTTVQGLSARYSVGGRVDNGMLDLVLAAEYVRQDNNKPYCTQAWHITGLRTDAEKKP